MLKVLSKTDKLNGDYFKNGVVLLVDKPLNWTSFDVVNKIRFTIKRTYSLKKIKVGHAGTLDPLASGLLIICVGSFTKKISELSILGKSYQGEMFLGATTPSYDMETEVNQTFSIDHISAEDIQHTAGLFEGKSMQIPPVFSAKKINGERAYEKARLGEHIKMKPSEIFIKQFHVNSEFLPIVNFDVTCSKGTYIRSLAHDFGVKLNTGAYLKSLVRTSIGEYKLSDAVALDALVEQIKNSAGA